MQPGPWDREPCGLECGQRPAPLGGATGWAARAAQEQETLSQVFRVTILASFILREVLNQQSQEPLEPVALAATL